MGAPLIEVKNLSKIFEVGGGFLKKPGRLHAVSNISFSVMPGETLCLVGESGCGKSTLGRCILQLIKPTSGEVRYQGMDLAALDEKAMRPIRQDLQMIFQDPYASLNPRMTVREIVGAPLDSFHLVSSKAEREQKIREICQIIGIAEEWLDKYPHEFSGGQRQRIVIARALIMNPKFVVCDEPVSALDVSVHAQILELLMDLQEKLGITYLFISHNLAVVKDICPSVAVMFLGHIMETGDTKTIFNNPLHPYTQSLLSAVLDLDVDSTKKRIILKGEVPSPIDVPSGCPFCTRCPKAGERCRQERPKSVLAEPGHFVACHQPGPL